MRQSILKEAHCIGLLLNTDKRQRRVLLQSISKQQLRAVIEIIYNVLQGYGNITEKDKKYLEKYRSVIRRLVDKRISSLSRKKLLIKFIFIVHRLLKVIQKHIVIQWQEN